MVQVYSTQCFLCSKRQNISQLEKWQTQKLSHLIPRPDPEPIWLSCSHLKHNDNLFCFSSLTVSSQGEKAAQRHMAQPKSASVPLQAPCTWPCSSLQTDYCHCFSRLCLSSRQHRIPNSNSDRPSPRDQLYRVRTMDTRGTERRARVLLLTWEQLNRPQDTLDPNATPSSSFSSSYLFSHIATPPAWEWGWTNGKERVKQNKSSAVTLIFLIFSQTSLCRYWLWIVWQHLGKTQTVWDPNP